MTPSEILAENYEAIEGICRRLPAGQAYGLHEDGSGMYMSEAGMRMIASGHGESAKLDEAYAKKQRGQRLVVIVTASETLYQFV